MKIFSSNNKSIPADQHFSICWYNFFVSKGIQHFVIKIIKLNGYLIQTCINGVKYNLDDNKDCCIEIYSLNNNVKQLYHNSFTPVKHFVDKQGHLKFDHWNSSSEWIF